MKDQHIDADAAQADDAAIAEASAAAAAPVLLAVDFSSDSQAALAWARHYAEVAGAPLEILHVVHDPAHAPGTYRADSADPLEPITDVAERKLAEFLEQSNHDNPGRPVPETTLLCVEGLPARKIVDVAEARGAQLLVLGGGRRNGLGRFVRGSTANQIARHARVPVTIVRANSG